jgi:ABC-type bacteriocin/lantibiotic exporter with double-glycine peptidase domain
VTGDVQSVRAFVDQVLIQSLILLLSLGVYLVYMLEQHVTLTLVCVASTPLLWLAATPFLALGSAGLRREPQAGRRPGHLLHRGDPGASG